MRLLSTPVLQVEQIQVPTDFITVEDTDHPGYLFGLIPKLKRVPTRVLSFAGRAAMPDVEIEDWPHPEGEKVEKVSFFVEGKTVTLFGVFAREKTQRVSICCVDFIEVDKETA